MNIIKSLKHILIDILGRKVIIMISNRLDRQFELFQSEYETKVIDVLRSGNYILGNEVRLFEEEFSTYIGTKYCVGLANGLDALWIALRVLNIGVNDEVIVPSNTYIATVMAVTMNQATPVFCEPDEYYNINPSLIESCITPRTKAILVVHLYGQSCQMDKIQAICKKYNLYLIEDCAQSHGSMHNNQKTGTFGDIGCFSFYPSKNLGCFGDGGAITTNSKELANKIRVFRNYGSEKRYHNEVIGTNSRLDELQAGLLRIKLNHIQELEDERNSVAYRYLNEMNNQFIQLPKIANLCSHVWHLFVIRCDKRNELIKYLESNGIHALIHYPIPPHLSQAYRFLNLGIGTFPLAEQYANEVLSLPLFNGMKEEEIDTVINVINNFVPIGGGYEV